MNVLIHFSKSIGNEACQTFFWFFKFKQRLGSKNNNIIFSAMTHNITRLVSGWKKWAHTWAHFWLEICWIIISLHPSPSYLQSFFLSHFLLRAFHPMGSPFQCTSNEIVSLYSVLLVWLPTWWTWHFTLTAQSGRKTGVKRRMSSSSYMKTHKNMGSWQRLRQRSDQNHQESKESPVLLHNRNAIPFFEIYNVWSSLLGSRWS